MELDKLKELESLIIGAGAGAGMVKNKKCIILGRDSDVGIYDNCFRFRSYG